MKLSWSEFSRAFESRTRRERLMIAALAAIGIPLAILAGWVEPMWRAQRVLAVEVEQLQKEDSALRVLAASPKDPNIALREELQKIELQVRDSQSGMAALARSLVAPAEMTALLEGLLRRQPGVRLVSLRSIAAEQVKANANAEHPLALFRHGVEVELEGSWGDLHGYLKAIEQSPKHLLWGQLDLKVRKYPRAVLKLTLYTLATESSWLQL